MTKVFILKLKCSNTFLFKLKGRGSMDSNQFSNIQNKVSLLKHNSWHPLQSMNFS